MTKTHFLILLLITLVSNSFSQHTNFFTYTGGEYADGISTTVDGGYVVFGRTGYNSNGSNYIITKLDKDGKIEWQNINNQFNGSSGDNHLTRIVQDLDGGYICIGGIDNVAPPYGNNSLIVKLDSLGGLVWNKQFDLGEGEGFGTINFDLDSNYLITGSVGNPNPHPNSNPYLFFSFILKVNTLGDSIWMTKTDIDSISNFQITNLLQKSNSNYLFGNSYMQPNGNVTKAIYKLDSAFNFISKTLLIDTANFYSIIDNYTSDTSFLTYNFFKVGTSNFYRKVDKYDLLGNRIFSSINPLANGGFQSDSTIIGITAHNTFGITNFKSNLTRNFTTYDLDTFNHIRLDHFATDQNNSSLWCGRADQTGWGYIGFIARFADTSQVGIKELIRQKESLFIYPNPVHDILNIKIPSSVNKKTSCKISIYNSFGQLFFSQLHFSNNVFQFDISTFPRGLYSCTILYENSIKTNNFIVY